MTDPAELIRHLETKYAGCQTYQDEGSVHFEESVISFKTTFIRSGYFKFQWTVRRIPDATILERNVIWSDGIGAHVEYDGQPRQRVVSLALAIAKASGLTLGAVHHVPALLMPEIAGESWTLLRGAYDFAPDSTDGSNYHIVRTTENSRTELWISKIDIALCKLFKSSTGLTPPQREALYELAEREPEIRKSLNHQKYEGSNRSVTEITYHEVLFDHKLAPP